MISLRTLVAALLLTFLSAAWGQDTPEADPPAEAEPVDPLRSGTIGQSWDDCQDQIDKVCLDYLKQLQEAVREEMLDNNLDEANRIADEIRFLEWKLGMSDDGSGVKKMPTPPSRECGFENNRARRARKRVESAIVDAYKDYIKELRRARRDTMRDFDLEFANTIQSEIDRIELKIGVPKRFRVEANNPRWQETLEVKRGEQVTIYARGRWSYGPGIPMHGPLGNRGSWVKFQGNAPGDLRGSVPGRLVGKLGNSLYAIGERLTIRVSRDDTLAFRMEDKFHNDNRGRMELAIVRVKEDCSIFLPN